MKKYLVFAAFAAIISFTSCEKDEKEVRDGNSFPVFTASLEASKTTINVANGKVSWELNDEITVRETYASKKYNYAYYRVASIDENGKATFVYKSTKSGTFGSGTTYGSTPYYATFGSKPTTSQNYSSKAGDLYMTSTNVAAGGAFKFTVKTGLMRINLTKSGEDIKKIEIFDNRDNKYTLTCATAQSISSAKDFYIALSEKDTITKIVLTNSSGCFCSLVSSNGVIVDINKIRPITKGENDIHFLDPSGPFYFSVSSTKRVQFSSGNLWTNTTVSPQTWSFESKQYNFPTAYNASHVSHFFWETTGNYGSGAACVTSTGTASDVVDWGVPYCSANGLPAGTWRTLTVDEWKYLFSMSGYVSGKRYGKYKANVTVAGSSCCIVIAPDNFLGTLKDSYTAEEWASAESTYGLVCMPARGVRQGTTIGYTTYCAFWTSSTSQTSSATCWFGTGFDTQGARSNGGAVRLVKAYTE